MALEVGRHDGGGFFQFLAADVFVTNDPLRVDDVDRRGRRIVGPACVSVGKVRDAQRRLLEERIVFLRRVVPGSADKSYGIHVARLAGLPPVGVICELVNDDGTVKRGRPQATPQAADLKATSPLCRQPPQAADRLEDVTVHRDVRGWDKPSDHVPVEGRFTF